MTKMYLMTEQQHAQIVDALEEARSTMYVEVLNAVEAALEALKAMKAVGPVGFAYEHQDYIGSVIGAAGAWAPNEIPLYTPKD